MDWINANWPVVELLTIVGGGLGSLGGLVLYLDRRFARVENAVSALSDFKEWKNTHVNPKLEDHGERLTALEVATGTRADRRHS